MPDYSRLPNALDVEVLLKSAAFWPVGTPESAKVIYAQEEAAIGVQAAAAEFEERTGWHPFLCPPSEPASARPFDVDARRLGAAGLLDLRGGLLSLESVRVNGQLEAAGAVLGYPSTAPAEKRPYTHLRFLGARRWVHGAARPLRIEVEGRWGRCERVPADAWAEILQYGTVKTLSQIENGQSIASLSQDGFSKSWDIVGIITQKDLLNEWGKRFDKAVERYKRMAA